MAGAAALSTVDIKFARMPTMMVTSRRDKIERLERLLLQPDLEYIKRGNWRTRFSTSMAYRRSRVILRGCLRTQRW